MNYGGTGNQAVNTTFGSDFKSDYQNKLLYNLFNPGVTNNYLDITICDVNGVVSTDEEYIKITWDNSISGEVPIDYNSYVDIILYQNFNPVYTIVGKTINSGSYKFIIPTEYDLTGVYTLKIIGWNDSSYEYEEDNWKISPSSNEYIKLKSPLSILIKPNNRNTSNLGIYYHFMSLDVEIVNEISYQLIKSDTTEDILIKLPNTFIGSGIGYVIAEYNWLEKETNSVIYSISQTAAMYNQLNICSFRYSDGEITEIITNYYGFISVQDNSNTRIEGYINIDKFSGKDAGNTVGSVPINNGNLNIGLDAERVDGYNINDLAKLDNILTPDLNANYLSDGTSYYNVGNKSGMIPLSNGTLNVDLNVEMINGRTLNNFVIDSHVHDLNDSNIIDGLIYKKLDNVREELTTNESFVDGSFTESKLDVNSFVVNANPLVVTGTFEGTLTYGNDQFTVGFDSNTFSSPPIVRVQPTFKNGTDYIKTVDLGYYNFTDYTVYETEEYAGRAVKIIITDTGVVSFIKDVIDPSGGSWEVHLSVDGPAYGNTTTAEMVVYYINTYSKLLTATWNGTETLINLGTFQCVENLPISHLGSADYQATYIQAYPSNITQSGFVLNYKIYVENLINNYLKKEIGNEEMYIHWIAIGNKL